jgi:hypothetical protein
MAILRAAGLKVLARVDHPPAWARSIPAENGPPDDPFDYADIVGEMAQRYANGFCRAYRGRGGRRPVILITAALRVSIADAQGCGGMQGGGVRHEAVHAR